MLTWLPLLCVGVRDSHIFTNGTSKMRGRAGDARKSEKDPQPSARGSPQPSSPTHGEMRVSPRERCLSPCWGGLPGTPLPHFWVSSKKHGNISLSPTTYLTVRGLRTLAATTSPPPAPAASTSQAEVFIFGSSTRCHPCSPPVPAEPGYSSCSASRGLRHRAVALGQKGVPP